MSLLLAKTDTPPHLVYPPGVQAKLEVKKIIRKLENLPTLPKVAARILEIMTGGEPDIDDVIKLIETDQAITMKILRLVNSARFGVSSQVTSIKKAVVLLGYSEVRCILLSTTVADHITRSLRKECGVEQDSLWKHSLASAICAEMLVGVGLPQFRAEAFVGGLLHDVGKLILEMCSPDKVEQVTVECKKQGMGWCQCEQDILGVDHATVGKWLAEHWKLPEIYIQAIWLHHHPLNTIKELDFVKGKEVVIAIHLADMLCHKIMADTCMTYETIEGVEALLSVLRIRKPGFLDQISASLGKHYSERATLLDLQEDETLFYYHALERANQKLAKIAIDNGRYRALAKAKDELAALHVFHQDLSLLEDEEKILEMVGRLLKERLNVPAGIIYYLFPMGRRVLGTCWLPESTIQCFSLPIDQQGKFGENELALCSKEVQLLLRTHQERLSDTSAAIKQLKVGECPNPYTVLPLRAAGQVFGEIALVREEKDGASHVEEETQEILQYLAFITETALARVKLVEELRGTAESLSTALSRNTQMLMSIDQCNKEFENLFECSNDAIILHRRDGQVLRVNQRATQLLGYSKSDLIDHGVLQEFFAEIGATLVKAGEKRSREDDGAYFETHVTQKQGTEIDLQVSARFATHEPSVVQSFMRDISGQKLIAKALSAEKERLSVTLRSIGDAVITTDSNATIVLMNKVAERLTGWLQEDAIGKPIMEVLHIIDGKTHEHLENPILQVIETGKTVELTNDAILIDKHGYQRNIADSTAPVIDGFNKLIGAVVVFRDITYKQKMEQEAIKAQKFESIGILAGGIAHDFNNILTAISGNISLARRHIRPEERANENLGKAEKACQRAMDLTGQLLTFAKGGLPIKKTASVVDLIKESADFVLRGSNVKCDFSFPDHLWPVEVDEGQINQVINNLIINADQAMPEGGVIRVEAQNTVVESKNGIPLKEGEYVKIVIKDQGIGIPQEDIPRIFDPYFTTKQSGNGLGLATGYSIIKKHDGDLNVESRLGVGTTFSIFLPAAKNSGPDRNETQESLITGRGKILLMDDEQEIRDMTGEMLKSIGYDMQCARDGAEAVKLYQMANDSNRPFDAVIIDLTIPGGMGGKEAVQKLREIDPQVKAIVSSGYTNDPVLTDFERFGFNDVITKPFNIAELSKILHKTIIKTEQ